jgi:DNA polymerase elongation subunit (family B)
MEGVWLNIVDVCYSDKRLPEVSRSSSLRHLQHTSSSSVDESNVILYTRSEHGEYVALTVRQPIGVHLQIPPAFTEADVQGLTKLPGVLTAERKQLTPVKRYLPQKPGQHGPSKLTYARLTFVSGAAANKFYRWHLNRIHPGRRKDGWFNTLRKLDLPTLFFDEAQEWFSVHHLEHPLEALSNEVSDQLGHASTPEVLTTGSWIRVADVSLISPANMIVRETCNARISSHQIVEVDNERVPLNGKSLSFDLETLSVRKQFPRNGKAEDVVFANSLSTTDDNGATIRTEVICIADMDRADVDALECTVTQVSCEQDLLNLTWERLRTFNPHFLMGFNTSGYDNPVLMGRSYLYHMCHTHPWSVVHRRLATIKKRVQQHRRLCDLYSCGRLKYRKFKQFVSQLFGSVGDFNPRDLPFSARVLCTAVEDGFNQDDYKAFAAGPDVCWFEFSGRIPTQAMKMISTRFESNQGTEMEIAYFDGWAPLDMWHHLQRFEPRLPDYSLKTTAQLFLPQQEADNAKIDLPYHTMFDYFLSGESQKMAEVVRYGARDAELPLKMAKHRDTWGLMLELARLHRTGMTSLIVRGQQFIGECLFRTNFKFLRYVHDNHPTLKMKIKGATVQDAMSNFYENPVATIDFKSLYPSEINQNNLCGSTVTFQRRDIAPHIDFVQEDVDLPDDNQWVGAKAVRRTVEDGVELGWITSSVFRTMSGPLCGRMFIRAFIVKSFRGAIPKIVSDTLVARGKAKKQMKAATDENKRKNLDNKQLALKISGNSIYGFVAGTTGNMSIPIVGALTTFYGRRHIEMVKVFVTDKLRFVVIYGDTDSVLIYLGPVSVATMVERAEDACDKINNVLFANEKSISIELDYIFRCLWLGSKKQYGGIMLTDPKGDPTKTKPCFKGIALVKRDAEQVLRDIGNDIFGIMMSSNDPLGPVAIRDTAPEMKRTLKRKLDEIIDDELPLEKYARTYANKSADSYANPDDQVNVRVARMINDRIYAGRLKRLPLRVGDRFPAVQVVRMEDGTVNGNVCQMTESLEYMQQHPELKLRPDRRKLVVKMTNNLHKYFQYHIPDIRSYLRRAASILSRDGRQARLMRKYTGITVEQEKANRWKNIHLSAKPVSRQAKKRKRKSADDAMLKRQQERVKRYLQDQRRAKPVTA